jgi:hypothetical protein
LALFILTGCSEKPQPGPPTEQEIHAADHGEAGGSLGRHPYRCEDRKPLFVDFRDKGLQVELRDAPDTSPLVLTAPTQGLQYVGEGASATIAGATIVIVYADGPTRICRKEGTN